jgi:hypothetical protein
MIFDERLLKADQDAQAPHGMVPPRPRLYAGGRSAAFR